MTLYKKVVLFVLLMLLPLNIVAISVTRGAMDTTVEQMTMVDHQLAATSVRGLSARMDNAFSLLYFFATENADCIQMMRQLDEESYLLSKLRFFVSLKNFAHMTDGADGYFYYLANKKDTLVYSDEAGSEGLNTTTLLEMMPDMQKQSWAIYTMDNAQYLVFMQEANRTLYGAWINLDHIREELLSGLAYETTEAIFSQKEIPVIDDDRVGSSVTQRGITLTITQQRSDVLRGVSFESRFLYITAIIYLVATPLLCGFIHHYLLKPLKTITTANRAIQTGNLDYRIEKKGNSPEYNEVFLSFNAMAEDLKTTKIGFYQKEAEKQTLELRNLQLQIRPHFLLNIFNLIYTLAQRNQSEQIEDTILYLSDYFRYIFQYNKETETFEKELEIIRGYLKVANFRYHNCIIVDIDVDDEIFEISVPPLLIHNFVENTIKHGIRQGQILRLLLKGRYKNGMVTVLIEDDGNGMDTQALQRNRDIFAGKLSLDNQGEHIGLYYSYKRLKSFFGEEATIVVNSELNKGTCFTISFSYVTGDENEPTDCE